MGKVYYPFFFLPGWAPLARKTNKKYTRKIHTSSANGFMMRFRFGLVMFGASASGELSLIIPYRKIAANLSTILVTENTSGIDWTRRANSRKRYLILMIKYI